MKEGLICGLSLLTMFATWLLLSPPFDKIIPALIGLTGMIATYKH